MDSENDGLAVWHGSIIGILVFSDVGRSGRFKRGTSAALKAEDRQGNLNQQMMPESNPEPLEGAQGLKKEHCFSLEHSLKNPMYAQAGRTFTSTILTRFQLHFQLQVSCSCPLDAPNYPKP